MTTVKGKFRLRDPRQDFTVEIEADMVDVRNVGAELALRSAFVKEAQRRLGGVCLNDWEFLRDSINVQSSEGPKS
jgi:hypothetical protein